MVTLVKRNSAPGAYEVPNVVRYLLVDNRFPEHRPRVTSAHLIRWIHLGLASPSLTRVPGRKLVLSFEDMVSMRVIAFLRAYNYSFTKIHEAESVLRNLTGHPRPFATQHIWAMDKQAEASVRFRRDIFAEINKVLMVATRGGQMPFPELVHRLIDLHGMTFDSRGVADTWAPHPGVRLNPRIQFGEPCIDYTRIPTRTIWGMVKAGDSPEFVAKIYNIAVERVTHAVDWEERLATTKKAA